MCATRTFLISFFVILDINKFKFGQAILKISFNQPILVATVKLANNITCPAIFLTTFLKFLKSSLRLMLCTKNALEDHNFNKKWIKEANSFRAMVTVSCLKYPFWDWRHILPGLPRNLIFLFVEFWKTKLTCDIVCFYKNGSNFAAVGMIKSETVKIMAFRNTHFLCKS